MTATERIALCAKFAQHEGTEIGDAVGNLATGARILNGLSDDHHMELVLLAMENICRLHITWLRDESPDYETYEEMPKDVFAYFTGGARKLTRQEWEARFGS